jgi:hypothetical protein
MLRLRPAGFAAIGISLLVAHATQAGIVTSIEAPGVQSSSALNTTTVNFDSAPTGYTFVQSFPLPGPSTAAYVGNQFVVAANQYGGAGGVGNYLSISAGDSVTLTLSASQAYFGLWVSGIDAFNQHELFKGNQSLGAFSGADPRIALLPAAYKGNPNPQFPGADPSEYYIFINFYAQSSADMFDTIVFTNAPGATGFESDNHTFSPTLQAPVVPEPPSLALGGIAVVIGLAVAKARHKQAVSV